MDQLVAPFFDALSRRDKAADGVFFYAVATTGVYCLPSCAAKNPRPENTSYYATTAAAEADGFRACKRCRPNEADANAALAAAACRRIEAAETPPGLAALAAAAGLSPSHFHRLFKAATGVTPKAYAAAWRAGQARRSLGAGASVTDAIYEAGYSAPSRFYAGAAAGMGMAPKSFGAGAAGQKIGFAVAPCSLGVVLAAHNGGKICAISLGDDEAALHAALARTFHKAEIAPAGPDFSKSLAAIVALVDSPARPVNLPLDIAGTALQLRVWQALRAVPAGATVSYTELAALVGAPKSVRAVAAACAANRLAVAIPCHRAVRADGGLAGYRWGLARKQALLDAEKNAS
jgi:AraC family transcriptional regulator of adaptative response/methylated-DNA-[protein]-cysteine methyltransferase